MSAHNDNGNTNGLTNGNTLYETRTWGYMRLPVFQHLCDEIGNNQGYVPGFLSNGVDNLWSNLLNYYFKVEYEYGGSMPTYLNEDVYLASRNVKYFRGDFPKKVLMVVDDDRVANEDCETTWSEAAGHLVRSMLEARTENGIGDSDHALYGIITVGHYSRYHTLVPGTSTLSGFDHAGYDGRRLHFEHDEHQTHMILEALVELTSQ